MPDVSAASGSLRGPRQPSWSKTGAAPCGRTGPPFGAAHRRLPRRPGGRAVRGLSARLPHVC